eukprot:GEMP01015608.1.p1 GENE.GEMP01015608.1~~GEMP01015608.1.p1  ORF type:complete len:540 (+),score=104.59 GEMP01015608.1:508-2127(+)
MLEKNAKLIGGTTKLAGGGWLWIPQNRFLREIGIPSRTEDIVNLLMDEANVEDVKEKESARVLLETFVREGEKVLDKLINAGLDIQPVQCRGEEERRALEFSLQGKAHHWGLTNSQISKLKEWMPSYCADNELDFCPSGRVLFHPQGCHTGLMRLAEIIAEEKKTSFEIRVGKQVVDIVMENGAVVGVRLQNGEILRSKATVFACGGFSQSKKWLNTAKFRILGSCATRSNTGDFLDICEKNSIPIYLDHAWWNQVVLPFDSRRSGVFFLNADSSFVVSSSGHRFFNEKEFYQERGYRQLQPEYRYTYFIFDKRAYERYDGPIKGLGGPIPWRRKEEPWMKLHDECLIYGDNATEIAQKLREKGYPIKAHFESAVEATVEEFNMFARCGRDAAFHRGERASEICWHVRRASDNSFRNKTMFPLDTKDGLYCVVLGAGALDTKSGPKIDAQARILMNENPIPGLYGAGNCVFTSTANSYPSAGTTIGLATVFGFIAGEHAAGLPAVFDTCDGDRCVPATRADAGPNTEQHANATRCGSKL